MEMIWSNSFLLHSVDGPVVDLLTDLEPYLAPGGDAGRPVYLAVRLDNDHWLVERASQAAAALPLDRLRARCEVERSEKIRLSAVVKDLRRALCRALVVHRRNGETPPDEAARFEVLVDGRDRLVAVGERPMAREDSGLAAPARTRRSPVGRGAPKARTRSSTRATAAVPRYIQGDLFRQARRAWRPAEAGLIKGQHYRLDVFIAPSGQGDLQADQPFRDSALDWAAAEAYQLQVVFNEIGSDSQVQSEWLELRREGRSSSCSFHFSPARLGAFSCRIAVLHDGRVLQTALLSAQVVATVAQAEAGQRSPARPHVEMVVHQDLSSLGERRHFDASLIMNHSVAGAASMTAISRDGAFVSSLDDLQAQLASISGLLQELATKSKIHTKGLTTRENAAWLCRLAAEGSFLYRKIVLDYIDNPAQSPAVKALHTAGYLQVISARPDAVVPLEFIYEYPAPKKDAALCPNAVKALRAGQCPAECVPDRDKRPADCVCPMGFWGLSRVIERHVHNPLLGAPAVIKGTEPTRERRELLATGKSLLAISQQVPAAEQKELKRRVKRLWKGGVSAVDWETWPDEVKAKKPILFIVLPHTLGSGADIALEIHGKVRVSRDIGRAYVCPQDGDPAPIVLLLGCDTANVADKDAYTGNIAVFRQAGSAIVIATTAALVWGADAARVAGHIIESFHDAAQGGSNCFGEILVDAKRRSVLASQLTAMSLAAFGDADWRVTLQ